MSGYALICLVKGLVVLFGWYWRRIDVKNAFVKEILKEGLSIEQPKGFVEEDREEFVYVLRKVLNGLRQTLRELNTQSGNYLIAYGFKRSHADPTLYNKHENRTFLNILVYVDNFMIFGGHNEAIREVVIYFKNNIEIRVEPTVGKFLVLTVKEKGDLIKIHNHPIIQRFLEFCGITECEPAKTPLNLGLESYVDKSNTLHDGKPYRQLIRSLLYLSNTVCRDIIYATGYLSRFVQCPTKIV